MKPLSTEKKLALKISLIAFLVLICIMGSVIVTSFAYGWNRTFNEFTNEQRMFDEGHVLSGVLPDNKEISGDSFGSGYEEEKVFRGNGPKKGPRDIIVFDKSGSIIKNEVIELNGNTKELLYSMNEDNPESLTFGERRFLITKKETESYTIFLLHDITPIIHYFEDLLIIGFIGSVLGFMIIFFMANHLAKITIQPIREHNKELESYSHNVAHELRTPLAVIRQNLELLRIKPTEKLITSTDEEILGMEKIIETLLFLAKPKAQGLKSERTNISAILTDIVGFHGKEILYTSPKRPVYKITHIELFKRVMDNLIQNAMKYKSEGLITLQVTEEKLSISNNIEADISEQEINKLTKVFYQSDTSRSSSGYGLGLALVKKIVELEGWSMKIKTENKNFIVEIIF